MHQKNDHWGKVMSILIVDTMDWGKPYDRAHPYAARGAWFRAGLGRNPAFKCQYVHWAQKKEHWKTKNFDLCILSGSIRSVTKNDYATQEMEKWVTWCIENEKKLIGICYGHQLIASVFGGKVEKLKSGPRVGNVNLKPLGQKDKFLIASGFHGFAKTNWLTSHLEHVKELPNDLEVLAESRICPIEAFKWKNMILGLQFHPEMNVDILNFLWRPHLNKTWTTRGSVPIKDQLIKSSEPTLVVSFDNFLYQWTSKTNGCV